MSARLRSIVQPKTDPGMHGVVHGRTRLTCNAAARSLWARYFYGFDLDQSINSVEGQDALPADPVSLLRARSAHRLARYERQARRLAHTEAGSPHADALNGGLR